MRTLDDLDPAGKRVFVRGDKLRLPTDLVAGREFSADTEVKPLDAVDVPDGWMGLDIGPSSIEGKELPGAVALS